MWMSLLVDLAMSALVEKVRTRMIAEITLEVDKPLFDSSISNTLWIYSVPL